MCIKDVWMQPERGTYGYIKKIKFKTVGGKTVRNRLGLTQEFVRDRVKPMKAVIQFLEMCQWGE